MRCSTASALLVVMPRERPETRRRPGWDRGERRGSPRREPFPSYSPPPVWSPQPGRVLLALWLVAAVPTVLQVLRPV
jgi:hypothetical protein